MNRIAQLDPTQATGKVRQMFDGVQASLGVVPNLFRVLGNAPAALDGYLKLSGALAGGNLKPAVREQLALTVAESNACGYCLSAHSFLGGKVGLDQEQLDRARQAEAAAPHTDALLKLARTIVERRGELDDAAIEQARAAGLDDAAIVEVVAHVALNIFTNYLNHVARTVVDFPEVVPGVEAAVAAEVR